MIARFKRYLHRRKVAAIASELSYLRAVRMAIIRQEFTLRGQLAVAEASQ